MFKRKSLRGAEYEGPHSSPMEEPTSRHYHITVAGDFQRTAKNI